MSELVVRPDEFPVPRPADLMSAIERAASDPSVDVAKMQALLDMAERMQAAMAKREFQSAMSRLQAKLPQIRKDGSVTVTPKSGGAARLQSRYATLENIHRVISPLLKEEGFAISFDTVEGNGKLVVIGELTHISGHTQLKQIPLALDTSGNKNGIQASCSTVSYGQRYLIKMFFNIVEEGQDLDGNEKLEPISHDQGVVIRDAVRQSGADEGKLLHWLGVPSIEEIPANRYSEVMTNLDKKKAARKP